MSEYTNFIYVDKRKKISVHVDDLLTARINKTVAAYDFYNMGLWDT